MPVQFYVVLLEFQPTGLGLQGCFNTHTNSMCACYVPLAHAYLFNFHPSLADHPNVLVETLQMLGLWRTGEVEMGKSNLVEFDFSPWQFSFLSLAGLV